MPRYEYHCDANDRTIEVAHSMDERLATWGEVCDRSGEPLNGTPADTPVEKVFSLAKVATSQPAGGGGGQAGGCGKPGCCRVG